MSMARPVTLVSLMALTAACAASPQTAAAPAYLVVVSLEGGDGTSDAAFRHTLQSDVATSGVPREDQGRVVLALQPRDPGTTTEPLAPAPLSAVTISRYRVRFIRADGRATPGVDVPYAFDGAATFTVGAEQAIGRFVLVRAQAKLEPPLVALRGGGGAMFISTLAEVTFYGRDLSGRDVTATGTIGVNFSDWPEATS